MFLEEKKKLLQRRVRACLVRVFEYFLFIYFTIHKMVGPTIESSVWLCFLNTVFRKLYPIFLVQNKILKIVERMFSRYRKYF